MLETLVRSGDHPQPTALPSRSRRWSFRFGGFPVFLRDATTISGPTGGATSSAKISWKSGLSSSADLAAVRVRLEDEVCCVLAEFGPPSDSMSPVSASDWTSSNPLESTTLSVSPGLSSGLSSQSGCARSSRTILPGCKSTSWIFPKTLDQMSTTTFLFSLV